MAASSLFAQVGPILTMTLAAIGSCVGCYVAGSASHGAMAKTEEGHGKFIGMSAAPSSQCIYGFILMLLLFQSIQRGNISEVSAIWIGLTTGLAFMASAIFQGKVCATGIQASLKQPSVYGKCFAAVGILESFALFVLVFTLMII